ncbi:hypothetical protein CLOM_g90 [Closterium sp. NIES-68]|nr:hypothetical protein CLOM_g90 [Closterium sp. NIES-68]
MAAAPASHVVRARAGSSLPSSRNRVTSSSSSSSHGPFLPPRCSRLKPLIVKPADPSHCTLRTSQPLKNRHVASSGVSGSAARASLPTSNGRDAPDAFSPSIPEEQHPFDGNKGLTPEPGEQHPRVMLPALRGEKGDQHFYSPRAALQALDQKANSGDIASPSKPGDSVFIKVNSEDNIGASSSLSRVVSSPLSVYNGDREVSQSNSDCDIGTSQETRAAALVSAARRVVAQWRHALSQKLHRDSVGSSFLSSHFSSSFFLSSHSPESTVSDWLKSAASDWRKLAASASIALLVLSASPHPALAYVAAPPRTLSQDEIATVRLFKETTPSVVNITNLAVSRDALTLDVLEVPQGSGSGFIWDELGHIVTNYHVIANAADIRVTLSDSSVHAAQVVGRDEDKDVAVLRINAPWESLHPVTIGSSSDLMVGKGSLPLVTLLVSTTLLHQALSVAYGERSSQQQRGGQYRA